MTITLVDALATACQAALAEEGIDWDEARLSVSYTDDTSDSALLSCLYRSKGMLSGVLVQDSDVWASIEQLRNQLQQQSGKAVMRFRISMSDVGSTPTIDYFNSQAPAGSPDWVWPDEPGYAGRAYAESGVDRIDSWEYEWVAGAVGDAADSLNRIRDWLTSSAPQFAGMLKPPATSDPWQSRHASS